MSTTSLSRKTPLSQTLPVVHAFATPVWHKSAPRSVRCAYELGDASGGWNAWKKHLSRRKEPLDAAQLLPDDRQALCWALDDEPLLRRLSAWIERLDPSRMGETGGDPLWEADLLAWLAKPDEEHLELGCALEALAFCGALPQLARFLSPDLWWALLGRLLATAATANVTLDNAPLVHQLQAGELAIKLAYLLPEIVPCRELAATGKHALSAGLLDLLDGKGLLQAKHIGLLRPLLACWTRSRALSPGLKAGCWSRTAEEQYHWSVRHALRLTRCDGSHAFSHTSPPAPYQTLFETALRLVGTKADYRIAALVLPHSFAKSTHKHACRNADQKGLPKPAVHSAWAAAAVLRPKWSRRGERLTVLYPDQTTRLELSRGSDVLLSGPWELSVRLDGIPVLPTSDWQQICWSSDKDVDYLELEITLGAALRVQRHILLARKDRFLLLADAVLGTQPGVLDYRGSLPLGPTMTLQQAEKTREGLLIGRKDRALVLPLGLPEWRSDIRTGELVQSGAGLELSQSATAHSLFAPLFFDLDRCRMARPATWRQLTVAQSLCTVAADVAVGYRVAMGGRQWLIYRSLAERANRTLLGHNLSTDMLVARFDRSGEVEPLIEIEGRE
jgi:hypothetical protein